MIARRSGWMRVSVLLNLMAAGAALSAAPVLRPDQPNVVSFPAVEAKFVRVVIQATSGTQPCIDELEVYAAGGKANLALASAGAKASASSCLEGYPIHQIRHLNDGRYGNSHSWIAAGTSGEWAQIELPKAARIARVVFSRDREGRYRDRMPLHLAVQASADGKVWKTVAAVKAAQVPRPARRPRVREPLPPAIGELPPVPQTPDEPNMLRFAFAHEAYSFWRLDRADPVARALGQFSRMIDRFAGRGMDAAAERRQLAELQQRHKALAAEAEPEALRALLFDVRLAKRRLMFRHPDLAPLARLIFVKRHPYLPSHNYSDMYDSRFTGGGGICTLAIPRIDGRLEPARAELATLFEAANGIPRDLALDWDARTVYFAYRPPGRPGQAYWNLRRMDVDGTGCTQITGGPFHDYYPCVLPDGDLVFVTTRCKGRFICWIPMAMTLFRCRPDGSNIHPLSHANLSEWGPSILRDGRILWTRSEYQDKGADFGHTLWAMRPDGAHPELVYGNNTTNCLMNGHQVPGTREICATLISHFGDFNGPIALIDPSQGRFNQQAARVITPDHRAMSNGGRFRDPVPISRDYVLVSHLAHGQWALYVIDRHGNRELLYMDPAIGSMCPLPLRPRLRPPVVPSSLPDCPPDAPAPPRRSPGRLVVTDVYRGLGPAVERGRVKYLRICRELRSTLERLPDGRLKETYRDFEKYYASPTDRIRGPYGWPTYVAKGVVGIVPVEADGSAHFEAPAGCTIYFQALDEDLNEVQRMRSVMQLQPGESRSCVGCHEGRQMTGVQTPAVPTAPRRPASKPVPPPWGAGPFAYERVVQPVLDAKCVRCHDAKHKKGINLTGALDNDRIPTSYRTLIKGGWVHHFNMNWHQRHHRAEPLTFGTVKSKLLAALAGKQHKDVALTADQMHAIKCWIDLNVPLWPDYTHRGERPGIPSRQASARPRRPNVSPPPRKGSPTPASIPTP